MRLCLQCMLWTRVIDFGKFVEMGLVVQLHSWLIMWIHPHLTPPQPPPTTATANIEKNKSHQNHLHALHKLHGCVIDEAVPCSSRKWIVCHRCVYRGMSRKLGTHMHETITNVHTDWEKLRALHDENMKITRKIDARNLFEVRCLRHTHATDVA